MKYFKYLILNWKVAIKSLVMFIFHFIHGIFPFKFTEHERYIKKRNRVDFSSLIKDEKIDLINEINTYKEKEF